MTTPSYSVFIPSKNAAIKRTIRIGPFWGRLPQNPLTSHPPEYRQWSREKDAIAFIDTLRIRGNYAKGTLPEYSREKEWAKEAKVILN